MNNLLFRIHSIIQFNTLILEEDGPCFFGEFDGRYHFPQHAVFQLNEFVFHCFFVNSSLQNVLLIEKVITNKSLFLLSPIGIWLDVNSVFYQELSCVNENKFIDSNTLFNFDLYINIPFLVNFWNPICFRENIQTTQKMSETNNILYFLLFWFYFFLNFNIHWEFIK